MTLKLYTVTFSRNGDVFVNKRVVGHWSRLSPTRHSMWKFENLDGGSFTCHSRYDLRPHAIAAFESKQES